MGKENLQNLLKKTRSAAMEEIYQETVKLMTAKGKFIYTRDKAAYYYDIKGKRLCELGTLDFEVFLDQEYGFVRSDRVTKQIISRLESYAFQHGSLVGFQKFCHFDPRTYTLYIDKGNSKMFRLDGDCIHIVDMGTDDVYFQMDYYEPIGLCNPNIGLADELLFNRSNFMDMVLTAVEQKFLLKWWFLSTFFKSIIPTKPILVIYGPPGSGKTETAKGLMKFLFGQDGDVNSPPNTVKNLQVIANSSHILVLDDIEKQNKKLESELVRMATGSRVDERKLHKNKEVSSLVPDSWIMMTTKQPVFTREDLIQRIFVLWLDTEKENTSSNVLQQQILDNRDKLWSEILVELNGIINRLEKNKNANPMNFKFRNAAWAEFVFRSIPEQGRKWFEGVLQKLNEDQIRFLLESNPLSKALSIWLKDKNNLDRWVESGELREELKKIAKHHELDSSMYKNNQTYGVELKNVVSTFGRIYKVESSRTRGRNEYKFEEKKATLKDSI